MLGATHVRNDSVSVVLSDKVLHLGGWGVFELVAANEVVGHLVQLGVCGLAINMGHCDAIPAGAVGSPIAGDFGHFWRRIRLVIRSMPSSNCTGRACWARVGCQHTIEMIRIKGLAVLVGRCRCANSIKRLASPQFAPRCKKELQLHQC